jgi:hypothetical protein
VLNVIFMALLFTRTKAFVKSSPRKTVMVHTLPNPPTFLPKKIVLALIGAEKFFQTQKYFLNKVDAKNWSPLRSCSFSSEDWFRFHGPYSNGEKIGS